jgi:hypothetical protein
VLQSNVRQLLNWIWSTDMYEWALKMEDDLENWGQCVNFTQKWILCS